MTALLRNDGKMRPTRNYADACLLTASHWRKVMDLWAPIGEMFFWKVLECSSQFSNSILVVISLDYNATVFMRYF